MAILYRLRCLTVPSEHAPINLRFEWSLRAQGEGYEEDTLIIILNHGAELPRGTVKIWYAGLDIRVAF